MRLHVTARRRHWLSRGEDPGMREPLEARASEKRFAQCSQESHSPKAAAPLATVNTRASDVSESRERGRSGSARLEFIGVHLEVRRGKMRLHSAQLPRTGSSYIRAEYLSFPPPLRALPFSLPPPERLSFLCLSCASQSFSFASFKFIWCARESFSGFVFHDLPWYFLRFRSSDSWPRHAG